MINNFKIDLNQVEVKGMERGSVHTSGDWFIIPKSEEYSPHADNMVRINCAPENANLFMQAVASPIRNRYTLNALGFNIADKYSCLNQLGMAEFWEEQFTAAREQLRGKLSVIVMRSERNTLDLPSDVTGLLDKLLELAVSLADTAGIKLHPKTLKAMYEYIQELTVQVKYVLESGELNEHYRGHGLLHRKQTDLTALVYLTYRKAETCTSFGTHLDDMIDSTIGTLCGVDSAYFHRRVWCAAEHLLWDFLGLNLFYSNGQFWPVGYGFQSGNPVLVLAKFNPDMSVRTQIVRIGRYFSCFDGAIDIRDSINDLKIMNQDMKSHLCMTEREWHDGYNGGVHSCMVNFDFERSPVRVYATTSHGLPDNDLRLFISYVGELFGEGFVVLARAIVNIETNQYVRAYGNNADAVLRAAGYTQDSDCTAGCILAKIEGPYGSYLMPYQDGDADRVDDCGTHWVLSYSGEYAAQDAEGTLYIGDEEDTFCCDRCEDQEPESQAEQVLTISGHELWCEDCRCYAATYTSLRGYVSDTLLDQEQEADEEDEEAA